MREEGTREKNERETVRRRAIMTINIPIGQLKGCPSCEHGKPCANVGEIGSMACEIPMRGSIVGKGVAIRRSLIYSRSKDCEP